ncbi:MAG: rod shape-determining protein MreC [Gammaproteobacteria bacterium]
MLDGFVQGFIQSDASGYGEERPIKSLFLKKTSIVIKLAIFASLSIVMMALDHRQGHLDSIRSTLSIIVYPVQYLVDLPANIASWSSETLVMRKSLLEENARLREQQFMLESRLQRFAVLESENRRLRELLDSSLKLNQRVLVAELLAVELQPYRRQIVIDKGKRQGAYNGQPVADARGIMGQITHVGPFSSTVLLITDPSHALPVEVNRNGLRAIAIGTGENNTLRLEHVPTNADIQEGDLLVSSGLDGRFPAGYPVGMVLEIKLDAGESFANISVTPTARLEQSREVLMIWPNQLEPTPVPAIPETAANTDD